MLTTYQVPLRGQLNQSSHKATAYDKTSYKNSIIKFHLTIKISIFIVSLPIGKWLYFQCDTNYPQTFALYDLDDDKKIYLEEFAQVTQCTKEEVGSVFDETDLNGKY